MDVPVIAAILLVTLALVFVVVMPLTNRVRRRRRDKHLTALAHTLGAEGPRDVAVPWWASPQRGVEFAWRGKRAAFVVCPEGRYDLGWLLLLCDVTMPRIHARRETSVDRLGKRLGLNREVQTGDAGFDGRVYLETDEAEALVKRAFATPATRAAVEVLLAGEHPNARLGPGAVAVRLGRDDGTPPHKDDIDHALEGLSALAETIPSIDPADVPAPRRMRGDVMAFVSAVAFVVSLFAMFALPVGYTDYRSPLLPSDQHTARAWTFGVWLLLVPATWLWVRGHSRSFRNFLGVAMLGFFPLVVLGTETLFLVNALFDRSTATPHDVTIARRRTATRKSDHRYLYIPWWDDHHDEVELEVSAATFHGLHEGDVMTVFVHAGALGWPWSERMVRRRAAPSMVFSARVRAITGHAPVAVGARCSLRVARRPTPVGYRCQMDARCGEARLYGSDTHGYFACTFDREAGSVVGSDSATSRADHDPAMSMDSRAGTLSVWDDRRRGAWRVDLDLDRTP